ncbi:MAG: 3-alpha,7-alpha,12-alpha-trihydroxy-5-beta-cholest-24-enoyl-CoA hydratase [Deltaproteobacteria bacterium]|nr:3-alpha,7-alpha,12-alpha-trihydroxy-5-beta-cholest-24-enoyl-CoA hydratase [Deltaproteobacteria bacterium]
MPIADRRLIGKRTGPTICEYTWKDVVLYAISVGATPRELSFVYEEAQGRLKVIPSFCVVPAAQIFPLFDEDIDWPFMIHGEQVIRLSKPFPPEGKIIQTGEVVDIFDKGSGALFHVKMTGRMPEGDHLYDAEWFLFYLGAGGFGGDPGPKTVNINPPEGRGPDFMITEKVAENQAILYRLNGDLNPLHLVPEEAQRVGFDKPVLHGLCTYGFATRAIINGLLDGEVSRLKMFKARFADIVYPGDTLTTQGWKSGHDIIVQVKTERSMVLKNALAVIE